MIVIIHGCCAKKRESSRRLTRLTTIIEHPCASNRFIVGPNSQIFLHMLCPTSLLPIESFLMKKLSMKHA